MSELPQLASAMLTVAFAAGMLVTGQFPAVLTAPAR
jgi:hypothetical protein